MLFVEHPLIKAGTIESRDYQQNIMDTARKRNLLVVLPTGLGKTPIAAILAAERMEEYPGSKVLVMAPTKPLVNQHFESFKGFLRLGEDEFRVITGTVNPLEREKFYRESRIIFATPQTVNNDLKMGRLDLEPFSLVVVDEIHHAIGRYAYPYVCKAYVKQGAHPRILGLTASPGGTTQKIKEICSNCCIKAVESRIEDDWDVSPYVQKKVIEWKEVELPVSFLEIREDLKKAYERRIAALRKLGFIQARLVTKKGLLQLQANLISAIQKGYKKAFIGIKHTTQAVKIDHAMGLLETQGIFSLERYFNKLRHDPKGAVLLNDPHLDRAARCSRKLFLAGSKHPKISALCTAIEQEFRGNPDSKIILFANYRDTVREIVSILSRIYRARPVEFVGQREGLTQAEQIQRITDFRDGVYNIMVGTSISEEGLDIPAMDLAVFYEPVASEIRSIQRRGRVGRQVAGKVLILITKNTRDEAYHWAARNKEKLMRKTLKGMSRGQKP